MQPRSPEPCFYLRFFCDFGREPYQNRKKIESFSFTKNSRNLRFLYDFGGASLSQKPFHHQNLIWSQNQKKNRKCNQGSRICFLAKNSRNSRLFYDFFTVFAGNRTKIVKKRKKKS
jgi:hypothetical protein